MKVTRIVQKQFYSVQKIANDRLFKTLVSALPSGIDWIDIQYPVLS